MKNKEILKLLFFSIATAGVIKCIHLFIIWERMNVIKDNFRKNLIDLGTYQQKVVEILYLEIVNLFVLPYVAAILFYFLVKIDLRPKNNFLIFILLFTLLFYLSVISMGYIHQFLK